LFHEVIQSAAIISWRDGFSSLLGTQSLFLICLGFSSSHNQILNFDDLFS